MESRKPIVESGVAYGRDPFILVDNGVYYMYITGWRCFKNTSGCLDGEWKEIPFEVATPKDEFPNAKGHRWAPEVYKHNGFYYMFTTYMIERLEKHGKRGCGIFRSESPEGPFVEISDGVVTPRDFSAIDGTFYVDDDGQLWMVWCHEWVCAEGGVGTMKAAKLSEDLTHFISEPVELFKSTDPEWSRGVITDGCYLYRTQDGQLLMLWSNNTEGGYCVALARSASGKVDGKWTQEGLLFSKAISGQYNGGHGMIFTAFDGQKYLSIHSPNEKREERDPSPVFVPIAEKNGILIWDGN